MSRLPTDVDEPIGGDEAVVIGRHHHWLLNERKVCLDAQGDAERSEA